MKIKKFNDLKEGFDPMIGVNQLLNDPIMLALVAYWLCDKKMNIADNVKDNLKFMEESFLNFANSLGYNIDKDALNYKFSELIDKVKKIVKNK